jgi:hypothetical protein
MARASGLASEQEQALCGLCHGQELLLSAATPLPALGSGARPACSQSTAHRCGAGKAMPYASSRQRRAGGGTVPNPCALGTWMAPPLFVSGRAMAVLWRLLLRLRRRRPFLPAVPSRAYARSGPCSCKLPPSMSPSGISCTACSRIPTPLAATCSRHRLLSSTALNASWPLR